VVYHWAYDYSVPGAEQDFLPQNHPRPAGDGRNPEAPPEQGGLLR
jgi:cytochrome c oxidase subunit I